MKCSFHQVERAFLTFDLLLNTPNYLNSHPSLLAAKSCTEIANGLLLSRGVAVSSVNKRGA